MDNHSYQHSFSKSHVARSCSPISSPFFLPPFLSITLVAPFSCFPSPLLRNALHSFSTASTSLSTCALLSLFPSLLSPLAFYPVLRLPIPATLNSSAGPKLMGILRSQPTLPWGSPRERILNSPMASVLPVACLSSLPGISEAVSWTHFHA